MTQRELFRLIIPAHPYKNVFSAVANCMTSLGPVLIGTSLNKSFLDLDVEIIDENNYQGPRDKNNLPDHDLLQRQRPARFAGFYCSLTSTMPRVFELASVYKSVGATTIAGGDHVGHLSEEALQNGIDIVVRGEGEFVVCEVIRALKNNRGLEKIEGISWKKNKKFFHNHPKKVEISDLDYPPRPDFSLLNFAQKIVFYPISRTRGCSWRCEFCTVRSRPRWASPEKLLQDILWLAQTQKARKFFIVDDRLNEDEEGTKDFFESVVRAKGEGRLSKKISFTIQIRLEAAKDEELLKVMRRAGVRIVCIGYESPIAAELKAMKKGLRPQDMVEYTKIFKRHGFWVHAMMIFGYPAKEEKILLNAKKRVQEFKKFVKDAKPDTLQLLLATPLPGTELYARLEKQGRLYPREIVGWENYDGGHLCFEPDAPMTALEVQNSTIEIMSWFYKGWNFWKIPLLIFVFPFIAPFSFPGWKRLWRNTLWGYMGHRIIREWLKLNAKTDFLRRLVLAQKKVGMN